MLVVQPDKPGVIRRVSASEPFALVVVFLMMISGFSVWMLFSRAPKAESALDTPMLITYQGKLTDASRITVPDSALNMKFAIYTSSSGASGCVWAAGDDAGDGADTTFSQASDCPSHVPSTAISVTPSEGVVTVILGASPQNAIPDALFDDNSALYLGVTVGADAEMTPRIRLTATPYAFQAGDADLLDGLNSTAFATVALSNLASVAINASLIPDSNDDTDLGSDALRWQDLYLGPGTLNIGTIDADDYEISYDTTNNALVFNEDGDSMDVRMEGDTDANLLFLDASTNRVGIGTATPGQTLAVAGTADVSGHSAIGGSASINDGSLLYPGSTFSNTLNVSETSTVATVDFVEGITNYLLYDPSATAAAVGVYGIDSEVASNTTNAQNVGSLNAGYFDASHNGSGTVGNLIGAAGNALRAAGSVTNAYGGSFSAYDGVGSYGVYGTGSRISITAAGNSYGGYFDGISTNAVTTGTDSTYGVFSSLTRTGATGGTINSYGVYVDIASLDAAGAGISSAYGLYLENVTGADTNYALYSAGGQSYHAGNFGIGDTSPASLLTVGSGDLFQVTSGGRVITAVSPSADSGTTNDAAFVTLNSPVDTTGTNVHDALRIDGNVGNATGGTNTVNLLAVDAITGDAQVTLRGINIGALTGTAATEDAILVGTGWDCAFKVDSTCVIDGSGSFSAAGGWTDGGTDVTLTSPTDNVGIGGASLGKLSVDGDTDEIQLVVQGNSSQTANYVTVENSGGTDLFQIDASGNVILANDLGVGAAASAETLANAGFIPNGDDLFVADSIGAEGNVYTDGSFIAGATLTLNDSNITESGVFNFSSALAATNGTNSAYNLVTSTDLGATDELLQVGDSAGTFMTFLGNGNVGVGDTTPDDLLNVHSAAAQAGIAITSLGTDTDALIKFELADGTAKFSIGVDDSDSDKFKVSTTALGTGDRFVIDSSGQVGIGTASPDELLHLESTTDADLMFITISDTDFSAFIPQRARNNAGAPELVANGDNTFSVISKGYGGAAYYSNAQILFSIDGVAGTSDMPGRITFLTTADGSGTVTERMRIDNAGYIGIGDTTPDALLDLDSDGTTTTDFGITNTALTSGKLADLATTSNAITSASLFNVSATQAAATGTSVSADIANLSFSPTYSTTVTTPGITGQVLDLSRSVTTNTSFASTLTVSGAVATISDSATQTTGTLTSTADVMRISQNYASNSGTGLNVLYLGTGDAFRVNDETGFSDATPFIIDDAGNVGIGDTTPDYLLDVAGTFGVDGNVTLGDASDDTVTSNAASWTFVNDSTINGTDIDFVLTGGTDAFTVDGTTFNVDEDNNRVGIGTATPASLFQVRTDQNSGTEVKITNETDGTAALTRMLFGDQGADTDLFFTSYNTGFSGNGLLGITGATLAEFAANTNSSGLAVGTRGASPFMVSTNATERMRVDSSGNVGIGATSPGALLDVDSPNVTGGGTAEAIQLRSAATTIALADGTTRANQRHNQFIAPTLDGVAAGGTETFTNAATVYIDAAPSGTNSTITNAYSLWVDAGAVRLDGDLVAIDGVTYDWPAANASGVLTNNGSGTLSWSTAGSGDITAVGSMVSGDAFADANADDDWLGLGAAAGRIEFDDQTIDEVNVLGAYVGIGTASPLSQLMVVSDSSVVNRGLTIQHNETAITPPVMNFRKSRGTESVPLTVADNDYVGGPVFFPYVSTSGYIATAGMTARVRGTVTATAAPSELHFFTNDTNVSDPVAEGVVDLTIDASGNVGVGDATPDARLDVLSSASAGTTSMFIDNTATDGDPSLAFQLSGTSTFTMGIDDSDSDKFKIGTTSPDTSTRLTINSSGSVGIGTTSPTAKFEVSSAGGANSGIGLTLTNAASYIPIDFNTPSGSPGGQFILSGASFSSGAFGGDEVALASELTSGVLHLASIGTSGIIKFTTGGNTTGNERVRIDASGNVGVGDTTPAALFTVGDGDDFQVSSTGNLNSPADTTWTLGGGTNGLNFDSNTLSIDALNDRVGIGTAAPSAMLHVNNSGTTGAVRVDSSVTTGIGVGHYANSLTTGVGTGIYSSSSGLDGGILLYALQDSTYSGTQTMSPYVASFGQSITNSSGTLTQTGNTMTVSRSTGAATGATTSVTNPVVVMSNSSAGGGGTITDSGEILRLLQDYSSSTGDVMEIYNYGTGDTFVAYDASSDTTPFTIDDDGNVGIGVASFPLTQKLQVQKDTNGYALVTVKNGTSGTSAVSGLYATNDTSSGAQFIVFSSGFTTSGLNIANTAQISSDSALAGLVMRTGGSGDPIIFGTANSERMRIDGSGYVGIGTDSPSAMLNVYEPDESTTQTNLTQAVTDAGILLRYDNVDNAYTGGLFWHTGDSPTKPKAGIYLLNDTVTGTSMYFGTSNSFATGITNDAMVIDPTGLVGIGDTTPVEELDVEGQIQFDLDGGSDTVIGVCKDVADGAGVENDVEFTDCSSTPGDVAEWYETTGAETAGDLVAVGSSVLAYAEELFDPATGLPTGSSAAYEAATVEKSSVPYAGRLFGIVSTSPLQTMGEAVRDAATNPQPIAISGRVPAKVNVENGTIAAGDPITSSSTAGVGMKATQPGMVVGYALDDWAGPGQGTIMVFVSPGFHMAEAIEQGPTGTASSVTPGMDSFGLALRGSGWDGAAAQATAMKLMTDVTDATTYKLSVRNQADTEVAYVTDDGVMSVASDMVVGGKLYPSALGVAQTDKYVFYGGAGDDFMRTNATGWGTGSYDFAEMFPSSQPLVAGEVVAFDMTSEFVKRAGGDDAMRLAGIVSTRPGFLAGNKEANSYPIALAGRVPTRISDENGAIEVGDALTVSATQPGYAMKATQAGMIIGYALEPFSSSSSSSSIITFVHLGYWPGMGSQPNAGTQNTASAFSGDLTTLTMNGNIYMQGNQILNVGAIAGLGGIWSVDAKGTFATEGSYKVVIESYQAEPVETVVPVGLEHKVTLSGTGTLSAGTGTIVFEDVSPSFNDITSTTAPVRVLVTLRGAANGIFVESADHNGFTVRETMGGVSDGVEFDWFVEAYRKDYEPAVGAVEEPPVEEPPPGTDPAPVTDPAATTDPSTADPAPTEPTVADPATTDPPPTDPAPTDPPPTDPAPVTEPAPTELPPADPAPTDPPLADAPATP